MAFVKYSKGKIEKVHKNSKEAKKEVKKFAHQEEDEEQVEKKGEEQVKHSSL